LVENAGTKIPPLRMHSNEEIKVISDYVLEVLGNSYTRPSKSHIASPVIQVPRKAGEKRVCIDFRQVNALRKIDADPLPLMEQMISESPRDTYFSEINLKLAYNQLRIKIGKEHLSAFQTPFGNHEDLVKPFGMCHSPSIF
jgi:hypothetical protein